MGTEATNDETLTLSIVTPSYNQDAFLEKTIQSVLMQDYPKLEYIIADGSTDGSPEIIRRYEYGLSRVFMGENRGFGEALHHTLNQCTGDIMAWINSDDFYLPHAFCTVTRIFEDCPEVDWLVGGSLICAPDGSPIKLNAVEGFSKKLFFSGRYLGGHRAWSGRWIPQESVFWRRSLWEKAGSQFLRGRMQYGDFELWSRFWQHADLYTVQLPIAAYRCHANTYTALRGDTSTEPCTKLLKNAGQTTYGPRQVYLRSLVARLGSRPSGWIGAPAKIVTYHLGSQRWHTAEVQVI